MKYFATALAMAVMTASCAAAGSRALSDADVLHTVEPGVAYRLPTTRATITATLNNGQITGEISFAITGDPEHAYYLSLENRAFTHNVLTATVDQETRLLTKVEVNSQAQLTAALNNLVPGGSNNQSGDTGVVLASIEVDPMDFVSAADDQIFAATNYGNPQLATLNRAVWTRINALASVPECTLGASPTDAQRIAHNTCISMRSLREFVCGGTCPNDVSARPPVIRVRVRPYQRFDGASGAVIAATVSNATSSRPCSEGVCVREPAPYFVTIWVAGQSREQLRWLTNRQPAITLPLRNAVFADRHITIQLSGGVVTSITDDYESEVAAFASLPLTLVSTIIEAGAAPLGFESDDLTRETAYLTAQTQLLVAEAALRAECAKEGNSCVPDDGAPPPVTTTAGDPARR